MREIRPIGELGNRVQEAGRIRMGVKTGKSFKAIDTWRFTSPHKDCIEQLAGLYGGEAKAWNDPKATAKNQWEVITQANQVRVLVPPGGLSQWYETWSGSRCERRCDGEHAEVPGGPDGHTTVPCLCQEQQDMTCKPYTRLSVVLPDIIFRGTWRLETKSWNAADELPAMERLIESIQEVQDIVEAQLVLEQRSRMTAQGKRNFVVPTLSLTTTAEALAAGEAGLRPALEAPTLIDAPALGAGALPQPGDEDHVALIGEHDDDVAEATIVYEPEDVRRECARLANSLLLEPAQFEAGVCLGVDPDHVKVDPKLLSEEELAKAMDFLADVSNDRIEVTGIDPTTHRLQIRRRT